MGGKLLITINPYSALSETIPAIAMQTFVIVMALLVVVGTLVVVVDVVSGGAKSAKAFGSGDNAGGVDGD